MHINSLLNKIYEQHDIVCNQKYGEDNLPYSFHLKAVVASAELYSDYIDPDKLDCVVIAAAGHDLIEDARMPYNDVCALINKSNFISVEESIFCADIIYACTEEKGKDRVERHSAIFFKELNENRYAVYVKLCDIMANTLYSRLMFSSMYYKYRSEFNNLREKLYKPGEYESLWNDLEDVLNLSN